MKKIIRNTLQKLIKALGDDSQVKVVRKSEKIWRRKIHVPAILVAVLSMILFFGILVFEVGFSLPKIIGLIILMGGIFSFFIIYLKKEERGFLVSSESIMLFGLLLIGGVLLIQAFKLWLSPIATPIAGIAVLTGLLLSRRMAIAIALILTVVMGILLNFSFEYFLLHAFSSFAGIVSLSGIRNRASITRLGLILAGFNCFAVFAMYLFGVPEFALLGSSIAWAVVGGISSAALVLLALPYLEAFFLKTTNIKLVELADFNQPLLKRLMVEVPGTYHHSLIMASIAEQAAEAIGANALLTRVGSYYHDVGKIAHPEYYIENQQGMANPHKQLSIAMSGLIVATHVKEGVALAKEYGLDRVIVDAIEQHHGTSVMHFFYMRALEQNKNVDQNEFRYPGPKPATRETAILMVADAAEAACRALDNKSQVRIKDTIEKIINNKFIDGQFSECPITLHDLGIIAESMAQTVGGIYHARVQYKEITPEQKS